MKEISGKVYFVRKEYIKNSCPGVGLGLLLGSFFFLGMMFSAFILTLYDPGYLSVVVTSALGVSLLVGASIPEKKVLPFMFVNDDGFTPYKILSQKWLFDKYTAGIELISWSSIKSICKKEVEVVDAFTGKKRMVTLLEVYLPDDIFIISSEAFEEDDFNEILMLFTQKKKLAESHNLFTNS